MLQAAIALSLCSYIVFVTSESSKDWSSTFFFFPVFSVILVICGFNTFGVHEEYLLLVLNSYISLCFFRGNAILQKRSISKLKLRPTVYYQAQRTYRAAQCQELGKPLVVTRLPSSDLEAGQVGWLGWQVGWRGTPFSVPVTQKHQLYTDCMNMY